MTSPSDLAQMRTDFKACAAAWQRAGWSSDEIDEAGEMVKADVEAGDAERIGCWAAWLAQKAADARYPAAVCRAAEQRIRARGAP